VKNQNKQARLLAHHGRVINTLNKNLGKVQRAFVWLKNFQRSVRQELNRARAGSRNLKYFQAANAKVQNRQRHFQRMFGRVLSSQKRLQLRLNQISRRKVNS